MEGHRGSFLISAAIFLLVFSVTTARGQTGIDLLIKPFLDGNSIELDNASAIAYPAGHESAEPDHFQFYEFDSDGRARFAIPGVADGKKILYLGYDTTNLDLAAHGPLLPDHLTDTSIAAGMPIARQGDNIWAISGGVGYAGNEPFTQSSAVYGKGDLIFVHPLGDERNLVLGLDYDGNRSVLPDVPFPGIAYQAKSGDSLEYVLGFPFCSAVWLPFPRHDITVTVDVTIPDEAEAQIGFQPVKQFNFFGGYYQSIDSFHIDDQPEDRRLFFQQQRFEAGVKWLPRTGVEVSLAAGYAFDQHFDSGFDDRNLNGITRVSDEPYLKLNATLRF